MNIRDKIKNYAIWLASLPAASIEALRTNAITVPVDRRRTLKKRSAPQEEDNHTTSRKKTSNEEPNHNNV